MVFNVSTNGNNDNYSWWYICKLCHPLPEWWISKLCALSVLRTLRIGFCSTDTNNCPNPFCLFGVLGVFVSSGMAMGALWRRKRTIIFFPSMTLLKFALNAAMASPTLWNRMKAYRVCFIRWACPMSIRLAVGNICFTVYTVTAFGRFPIKSVSGSISSGFSWKGRQQCNKVSNTLSVLAAVATFLSHVKQEVR